MIHVTHTTEQVARLEGVVLSVVMDKDRHRVMVRERGEKEICLVVWMDMWYHHLVSLIYCITDEMY
jgi:hypothetical protein